MTKSKVLTIQIVLCALTVFSGVAFFWWTVRPNLQVRAFHKAMAKTLATGDYTYITEDPSLFTPVTIAQPMLRYFFVQLLIRGYSGNAETQKLSLGLMPFAESKLEEIVPMMKPYLNAFIDLGKAHEIVGRASGNQATFQKELENAAGFYQKAIDLVPAQQTAVINYAVNLYNRGKIDEAIKILRDSIAEDSSIPDLHYYLGQFLVYQNEKNSPEGLQEIERSYALGADIDPALSKQTYQKLLFYFAKMKDKEHIVPVLERLTQIDPTQAAIYNGVLLYIAKYHSIPPIDK